MADQPGWHPANYSKFPIRGEYLRRCLDGTHTVGNVAIDITDNENAYGYIFSGDQFRYVIIPGAALTAAKRLHINLNDYSQVKRAFNLKD